MSFSEPLLLLFLEKTGSWVAGRKPLLNPVPRAGNSLVSGSAQRSSDLKRLLPQHLFMDSAQRRRAGPQPC